MLTRDQYRAKLQRDVETQRAEDQARCDQFHAETLAKLESLVNQTVIAVEYNREREGSYSLHFADGRTATFSSSGDDATWTSFEIVGRDLMNK